MNGLNAAGSIHSFLPYLISTIYDKITVINRAEGSDEGGYYVTPGFHFRC